MKYLNRLLIITAILSFCSCTNYRTQAQNDAATGALIGAGAGALLSGDSTEGAVKGAAVGGGAGYIYGKSKEN